MSELRQLQQSFLNHLLGTPSEIGEYIQSTPDNSAQKRLSVYASAYRLRLKEAILADHDSLHGYLGDETFDQLMESYINTYRSQHPSLRYYSKNITQLLNQQKPFSDHPELVEIAKIEQAFNNSFDAANCATFSVEQLGQLAPESWPNLQLMFHASVQILPCEYNSFPIWKALSKNETPPTLEKESTMWIIWRKDLISRYRTLTEAESHTIQQAMQGANFSEICEGLLDYYCEEDTPVQAITFLKTWINEMMVCDISNIK